MRMINKHVLVRPDMDNYETVTVGNTKLLIDTQFEANKHSCVSGEVLEVADGVTEIKKGDIGLWHYHDIPQAIKQMKYVMEGEWYGAKKSIALPSECFYLVIRNGVTIAVNGAVIVEAVTEVIETKITLPEHIKNQKSLSKGIVRYLPEIPPIDGFNYSMLEVGTTVFFAKHHSIPLQYDMHQIIDKGKTLYRLHYDRILAYTNLEKEYGLYGC